jgi:pyrimidine deaminase RibD-like protein
MLSFMDKELEVIANLEYGKAVERIAQETQEKVRKATTGMPRGGQIEATRLRLYLEQAKEICQEWSRIWVELLEAKHGGYLSRDDANFIIGKVREMGELRKRDFTSLPDRSIRLASASAEIDAKIAGFVGSITRDIEIRIRKQESLPKHSRETTANVPAISVAEEDRKFALLAIEEARKSVPEDERPHPKVGAVVVKSGSVLSKAHRGENPKSHAEYIALEEKLPDDLVAGATVYTTLEPCTTRRHPKIPCAQRLVDRKVARVVIGMLDPNPEIRGLGDQLLSEANIETQLFPRDLRAQVEEMNREFIRTQKQKQTPTKTNEVMDRAVTIAARSLSDATWDLQKAAWSFCALHTQYLVARAARDIADEEKQILESIAAAFRVFTQDYDLPAELSATAKSEIGNINIALVNLKAFSMTGQRTKMEIAATQIQDACERIRIAARPYAYRSSA